MLYFTLALKIKKEHTKNNPSNKDNPIATDISGDAASMHFRENEVCCCL